MKEELAKVRKALARQSLTDTSILVHYLVHNHTITASDGKLTACTPFPYDGTFLVPGIDFERQVDRIPDPETIAVDPQSITVKGSKMRGTINTLDTDFHDYHPKPGDVWSAVPPKLLEALALVRPFISDNAIHPWALCAAFGADHVYATTNVSLIKVDCPMLDGAGQLLPYWAIDYLLARKEELVGVQIYPNYAAFKWDDDSWIHTKLMDAEFPTAANQLFQKYVEPEWEITDDWRTAYELVSGLSEGLIELYPDKIVGRQNQSITEHAVPDTPVPDGFECTKWPPKFLDAVIDVATHWQPDMYPNPSIFAAPAQGVRGFIVGRT
jgi:hypothetical protein